MLGSTINKLTFLKTALMCLISNFGPPKSTALAPALAIEWALQLRKLQSNEQASANLQSDVGGTPNILYERELDNYTTGGDSDTYFDLVRTCCLQDLYGFGAFFWFISFIFHYESFS